jgi:acyl carrier protein
MLVCADAAEACRQLRTSDGSGEGEAETAAGPALRVEAAEPLTRARLEDVGRRWLTGAPIQWSSLYSAPPPRRVPLPPYPFARRRHWIDPPRREQPDHSPEPAAPPPLPCSAAANVIERRVTAIWREVLGGENISGSDDFFALGGDSLIGTELVARLSNEFGVDLPLSQLAEAPTVTGITRVISEMRTTSATVDITQGQHV